MAKFARKAGEIFFVLAISFLLILGCVFAVDTKNDKDNVLNVVGNAENDMQVIADVSYTISPQASFEGAQKTWASAIDYALQNTQSNVLVKLLSDWNAVSHMGYTQSFHTTVGGEGFSNGRLCIPKNANIILDLNGHKINRNLGYFYDTSDNETGGVIYVEGTLRLIDSAFDSKIIYDLDDTMSINNKSIGKITQGGSNYGGGININGGKFYMYGGAIVGNNAHYGGGIYCSNGEVHIYDGIIAENTATNYGGAVASLNQGTINIYGGHIFKNIANYGGGIHSYDDNLNVSGGKFSYNQAKISGGGIHIQSNSSTSYATIKNSILCYNKAVSGTSIETFGGAIDANTTIIKLDGVEIRNNKADKGSAIGQISDKITIKNSIIIDNQTTSADGYALQLHEYAEEGIYLSLGTNVIITHNLDTNSKERNLYLDSYKHSIELFEHALNSRIGVTLVGDEFLYYQNILPSKNNFEQIASIFYNDEDGNVKGSTIQYYSPGSCYRFYDEQPTAIAGAKWMHNGYTTVDESGYVEVPYRSEGYSILYTSSSGTNLNYGLSNGIVDLQTTIAKFKEVGTYIISADVQNKGNYITRRSTLIFRILPKEVTVEWETNSLVYNTLTQKVSLTISGLESGDTCIPTIQNVFGGLNVGTGISFATGELSDNNYKLPMWDRVKTFTITPRYLDRLEALDVSAVYNNKPQSIILNNYDSKFLTPLNYQTNVGEYTQTVSIKSPGNCYWKTASGNSSGTDTSSFTFTWEITPKPIEKPTESENKFVFNNKEQTYIPNGFDSSSMLISNNKQINVGMHIVTIIPSSNHKWIDGTSDRVEFQFRILPAGVLVKDEVKYDYQYIDSNNIRQNYGNMYMHKLNDENLNVVNGIARHILGNIPINTTIDTFLNNLQSDRNLIKIYAKETDTTPIYDGLTGARNEINRVLATGFKVELYNDASGQEKLDTIYLSVLGDINGDGRITASDISYLRQVANNNALLESMPLEKQLACMVNNRGGVTSVDCEIIRNVIANEIELEIFFESSVVEENKEYTYLTLDKDNLIRGTSETQTNVIGNIAVNTNVATFKEKLAVLGIDTTAITIHDRKGSVVTDNNAIVGTGWSIVTGGATIFLSVIGDLNGDGRITATDISYLREIATSDLTDIEDYDILSAILINKGGISNIDSEVLRVVIENKTNLNNY